jgi:selenocysteine lyase/cysteine desulfurase
LGGVQTPGILIVKKEILRQNPVPVGGGGGGAVFFVMETDHRFLKEPELREEAGTPAIVESIRAGMTFNF